MNGICDVHICQNGGENDKYIYSPEKVERTINALASVDVLFESKIQCLIDTVYGNEYDKKEQEIFDTAKRMFEPHLQCIVPFIEDKSGRDEFENLFKSIPVVPSIYWDDYSAHIKAKEYYEAEGYVAQIQDYRFCQLKKDGQICRDERFTKMDYHRRVR